jgi:VanZ family protein
MYWRWAFFACLAVVMVLALAPPRTPMPSTGWDKVNHALAFAVLAVLGRGSYAQHKVRVLLGLLAYGGVMELLQGLTGYRSAEWLDLAADAAGLLLGWPMAGLAWRRAPGNGRAGP